MGGNRIILDAGALSAYAAEEEPLRVALRAAVARGVSVCVPAPVITESTTGSARDARVNAALKSCNVIPLDESLARAAGAIRFRCTGAGAVDAMVVACADLIPATAIITGDVSDLQALASVQNRSAVIDLNEWSEI